MNMNKLVMVLLGVVLMTTVVSNVDAITIDETITYLWCLGKLSHVTYSCGRIALYLDGECKRIGQVDWPCDNVPEYIQNHGLQNERRLTQNEVVEDFRILDQMKAGIMDQENPFRTFP
jgi:hypothetical protein